MSKKKKKRKKHIIKKILILLIIIAMLSIIGFTIYYFTMEYCPDGYSRHDGKCSKYVYSNYNVDTYCPLGYTMNGDICNKKNVVVATTKYTCNKTNYGNSTVQLSYLGLIGTQCKYEVSHVALEKKYCRSGCYLNTPNQCTCRIETNANVTILNRKYYYHCLSGDLVGNKCVSYYNILPNVEKYCLSGYMLLGNKCSKYIYENAGYYKTCPTGYVLNGNNCEQTFTQNVIVNKYCPDGYEENNGSCRKIIYYK